MGERTGEDHRLAKVVKDELGKHGEAAVILEEVELGVGEAGGGGALGEVSDMCCSRVVDGANVPARSSTR